MESLWLLILIQALFTAEFSSLKGILADVGETIHLGKINGRDVFLSEADSITFEKGVSPIEFHKPDDLLGIMKELVKNCWVVRFIQSFCRRKTTYLQRFVHF
jgi:hypothetical protein